MKTPLIIIFFVFFLFPFAVSAQMQTMTTTTSELIEGKLYDGPWTITDTKRQVTDWYPFESQTEDGKIQYFCRDLDSGINPSKKSITGMYNQEGSYNNQGQITYIGREQLLTSYNDINHDDGIIEYYCVTNITETSYKIGNNPSFSEYIAESSLWAVNVLCDNGRIDGSCVGTESSIECPDGYEETEEGCSAKKVEENFEMPCLTEGLRECTSNYNGYKTCTSGSWIATSCGKGENCLVGECVPAFRCEEIIGENDDGVNVNGIQMTYVYGGQEHTETRHNICSTLLVTETQKPLIEKLNYVCDDINTRNAMYPNRLCDPDTQYCGYSNGRAECFDTQTSDIVKQESGGVIDFFRRLFGWLISILNPILNANPNAPPQQIPDTRKSVSEVCNDLTYDDISDFMLYVKLNIEEPIRFQSLTLAKDVDGNKTIFCEFFDGAESIGDPDTYDNVLDKVSYFISSDAPAIDWETNKITDGAESLFGQKFRDFRDRFIEDMVGLAIDAEENRDPLPNYDTFSIKYGDVNGEKLVYVSDYFSGLSAKELDGTTYHFQFYIGSVPNVKRIFIRHSTDDSLIQNSPWLQNSPIISLVQNLKSFGKEVEDQKAIEDMFSKDTNPEKDLEESELDKLIQNPPDARNPNELEDWRREMDEFIEETVSQCDIDETQIDPREEDMSLTEIFKHDYSSPDDMIIKTLAGRTREIEGSLSFNVWRTDVIPSNRPRISIYYAVPKIYAADRVVFKDDPSAEKEIPVITIYDSCQDGVADELNLGTVPLYTFMNVIGSGRSGNDLIFSKQLQNEIVQQLATIVVFTLETGPTNTADETLTKIINRIWD